MAATPETGFFVIADLTGYTAYLSRSELEHAPAIAGDLLETIGGRLDPPFRLAKFEGDAAFLWVEDGRADGSLLTDALEASYLAFRRRLRSIEQATSCECNSCRLAPRLDLKLFVHHGSFVRSRIAGRDELAGSDVILAHRLLKGAGAAAANGNGFALFTAQAVAALGLDSATLGLTESEESFNHLGRVSTFTLDLEARWQAESGARRLVVGDGDLILDLDSTVGAAPAVVWAHLTSPAPRTRWEGPLVIEETLAGGRRGVGTTAQCVTGRLPPSRRSSTGNPTTTSAGGSPCRTSDPWLQPRTWSRGVQQWDRVVAVDDQAVRAPAELQTALRRHAIGEEVRLRIARDGESREVVVRHASDLP